MQQEVEAAEEFARARHAGQMYGGEHSFAYHLERVVGQLRKFGHTKDELLAAAWLHDVAEDTPVTIRQLQDEFGSSVSKRVDAVTDITHENGVKLPNRRARQTVTYENLCIIAETYPDVINLKLADRIANMEASLEGVNGSLLDMYLTEHPFFCRSIGQSGGDPKMWDRLDKLVRDGYDPAGRKKALRVIERFGGIDGEHNKTWVIAQVARALTGKAYPAWVTEVKSGDDGPNTYDWDEGIAP